MSSTNRGRQRNRQDFYETPVEVTNKIIRKLFWGRHSILDTVLDPCCGTGKILDALHGFSPAMPMRGIELVAEHQAACNRKYPTKWGNALEMDWGSPELVVTNPPYSLAREFIEKSLASAKTTAMLLRLNFLGSRKRRDFWHRNPCDVFVLSERPSFTSDGATDSCEYAWFVWWPEHRRMTGRPVGHWEVL